MPNEKQEIYGALVAAQNEIKAAGKSGENKYDNYTYAMLKDYCDVIHEPMVKNGLALSVNIEELTDMPDRTTSQGKIEHAVRVKLKGIVSHKSGETLEFIGWGEGQDRADKGLYKAITGGKKYLIANIFNVPTSDDPETDSHEDFDQRTDKPHQAAGNGARSQPAAGGTKAIPAPQKAQQQPPAAAPAGKTPLPVNDEEQIKKGLINSTLINELKEEVRKADIPAKTFMEWLAMYSGALAQSGALAAPIKQIREIPAHSYKEILQIVQTRRDDIIGKPADGEPLPEPDETLGM